MENQKKKLAAQARFCVTDNVRWGINSSSIVGSRLISHCWESNKKKVYSDFKLQYKQTISILLRKGTPNTACVGVHWSMSSYSADLFVNAVLVVRAVRASQTQSSPFHCSDFTSIHLRISLVKWKLPDITHHLIFWATTCNIRVRQGRERKKKTNYSWSELKLFAPNSLLTQFVRYKWESCSCFNWPCNCESHLMSAQCSGETCAAARTIPIKPTTGFGHHDEIAMFELNKLSHSHSHTIL